MSVMEAGLARPAPAGELLRYTAWLDGFRSGGEWSSMLRGGARAGGGCALGPGRQSGGVRGCLPGRRPFANPPGRATSRCPAVSGTNRTRPRCPGANRLAGGGGATFSVVEAGLARPAPAGELDR